MDNNENSLTQHSIKLGSIVLELTKQIDVLKEEIYYLKEKVEKLESMQESQNQNWEDFI